MSPNGERDIRQPAVAGQFYPARAEDLRTAITQAFVSPLGPGAVPVIGAGPRQILGVVSPHAGYLYSAAGTAWGLREVAADGRPALVVVLGVNHRGIGASLALSPAAGWATPLGIIPLAHAYDAVWQAAGAVPDARAHAYEHSLEVQVPFLQYLFGELPIVPLAIGDAPLTQVAQLGAALAAVARTTDILIVASTDFSHYIPHAAATERDRLALEQIARVDPEGLLRVVRENGITMCGVLPVTALLFAAREFGALDARVLHYHTSGEVSGDRREVVGYGAAVVRRQAMAQPESPAISTQIRQI